MTLNDIKAVIDAVNLKDGVKVSYTHDAYGSTLVELRETETGLLIWRSWSYCTDFESDLKREVARVSSPKDAAEVQRIEAEKRACQLRNDALFYMANGADFIMFCDFTEDELKAEVEVIKADQQAAEQPFADAADKAGEIYCTAIMLSKDGQILAPELDASDVVVFEENGADVYRVTCADDSEALALFSHLERIMDGSHPLTADLVRGAAETIDYIVDAVKDGALTLPGVVVRNTAGLWLEEWGYPSTFTTNPLRAKWFSQKDMDRGAVAQYCRNGEEAVALADAIAQVYALRSQEAN